jgi:hypothetical protein
MTAKAVYTPSKAGTPCFRLFEFLDATFKRTGKVPTRHQAISYFVSMKMKPASGSTLYGRWRKSRNLKGYIVALESKKAKAPKAEKPASPAAPTAPKAENKASAPAVKAPAKPKAPKAPKAKPAPKAPEGFSATPPPPPPAIVTETQETPAV